MTTKKTRMSDLPEFDMAHHLKSDEDIADGDAAELAHALGVAARARGMSQLYKALRPNAKPRFDTINRVCAALGVRLKAEPVHHH